MLISKQGNCFVVRNKCLSCFVFFSDDFEFEYQTQTQLPVFIQQVTYSRKCVDKFDRVFSVNESFKVPAKKPPTVEPTTPCSRNSLEIRSISPELFLGDIDSDEELLSSIF